MLRILILLVSIVIACSAVAQSIVKPGDSVSVICQEESSLSREYSITRDGFIIMQFIGAVSIAGLKEAEAATKISATLIEQRILQRATIQLKVIGAASGGLISFSGAVTRSGELYPRAGLRLADVVREAKPTAAADLERVRIIAAGGKIIVVNFSLFDGKDQTHNPEVRSGDRVLFDLLTKNPDISVVGMVRKPGAYQFTRGMSLQDAIDQAGGFTPLGDGRGVRIERDGSTLPPPSNLKEFLLVAGDRIFVPQAAPIGRVNVSGLVTNPGQVELVRGMTLVDAIKAAGGPKKNADLRKVKLHRAVAGKVKVTEIDLSLVGSGKMADPPVQPDDLIELVGTRKKAFDFKTIGSLAAIGILFGVVKF